MKSERKKVKQVIQMVVRVLERTENFLAYVSGLLLLFMIFGICYDIVLRYFFSRPTIWVTGVTEYILLYVTFLAGGWILRREGHVKVDLILSKLNQRNQAFLNAITSGIGMLACGIMAWYGASTNWSLLLRGTITAQVPQIPKFITVGVVPLGFFFLAIGFLRRALDNFSKFKVCETGGNCERGGE